jgi:hypothetical protein
MKEFKQYRWFNTSTKKLVVGGKSAIQNDSLISELKSQKQDKIVMHTAESGSPFTIILAHIKKTTKKDIEQTAIFTACFSQQWKKGKKTAEVHIFKLSQLHKSEKLKAGTWQVQPPIEKSSAPLELALTIQSETLRAVPINSIKKSQILLKIKPGKKDKIEMIDTISKKLKLKFNQEQIMQALPPGPVAIKK